MKSLMVVDMQKGFMNENNMFLIDKINTYLNSNDFDYIFYTKFNNRSESLFSKLLNWNEMTSSDAQELAVDFHSNAIVFEKDGYGLTKSQIDTLKKMNITEIEICGTDIDACVLSIMFNLFDAGIKPILLKDLTSSSTKDMIPPALKIIKNQFGESCIK